MTITTMPFSPTTAVVGGSILGAVAVGRMALNGKITGCSGMINSFFTSDLRNAPFVGGLFSGGLLLSKWLLPMAIPSMPAGINLGRIALAGGLVGVGTQLGSGCTSGHGVCGLGRRSPRSLVSVLVFMGAGMLTASLFATSSLYGPAATGAPAHPNYLQDALTLFGITVGVSGLLGFLGKKETDEEETSLLRTLVDYGGGVAFGLGLGYTGMSLPSRVAGFLDIKAGFSDGGAWDPTLAMVMAGAVTVSLAGFAYMQKNMKRAILGGPLNFPTKTEIDWRLVSGAALFGAGWGLGGICPGPAVVALVGGDNAIIVFNAAMVASMILYRKVIAPQLDEMERKAK